jgi:hypothetical protein
MTPGSRRLPSVRFAQISLKKSENEQARKSRICAAGGVEDAGWPRGSMKLAAGADRYLSMTARIVIGDVNPTFSTISAKSGPSSSALGTGHNRSLLPFRRLRYDRTQLMDKAAFRDFTIQVVKRSDAAVGFEVIPRRWVGRRAHVRLDDALAPPRARLRRAHRLFRSHDPRRLGIAGKRCLRGGTITDGACRRAKPKGKERKRGCGKQSTQTQQALQRPPRSNQRAPHLRRFSLPGKKMSLRVGYFVECSRGWVHRTHRHGRRARELHSPSWTA